METVVFGGGCFWCVEAVVSRLKGILSVMPGYAGGKMENPTYEQVCTGETGHAEVARIEFDPQIISFEKLLDVFFKTHDATSLNRQGNDVGTQYRSVILYTNEKQKREIEEFIGKLQELIGENKKIVTEFKPLIKFYPAEDYHKKYFENHADLPYCRFIIQPKVKKIEDEFDEYVVRST
jgi:peptide-methionine (S)-S-oxide reductase